MSWYYGYYPKAKPPPKALPGMNRKQYGEKWWSKQWLAALNSFEWENRLARGRSYARAGRVKNYKILNGLIKANVEGSSLYNVKISLKTFSKKELERPIKIMSENAIFAAKLLAGEMPADIEEVFKTAKTPLIPSKPADIKSECSCPDFANPCKHIAAVFYVIADDLDNDPFVLFELRGIGKKSLLERLREDSTMTSTKPAVQEASKIPDAEERDFWEPGKLLNTISFSVEKPDTSCIILKKIGKPTFWTSKINFEKDLFVLYERISKKARGLALEADSMKL